VSRQKREGLQTKLLEYGKRTDKNKNVNKGTATVFVFAVTPSVNSVTSLYYFVAFMNDQEKKRYHIIVNDFIK
jgi:hypothetical protein